MKMDNSDNSQGTETQTPWEKRVLKLAKKYGAFVRFSPEGSEGGEGGEATSVVNVDGSFKENWHEPYGEENKATLSRYTKFDDLVNSHMSLRKKLGKNADSMVELPTENSLPEVHAAFHAARGVPKTDDGYEYTMSPELTAKLGEADADRMAKFKTFAREELHLTPAGYKRLLDFRHNDESSAIDAMDIHMAEQTEAATKAGNQVLTQMFKDDAGNRKVRANALFDKYGLDKMIMPDGKEATIKGKLFEENPNLLTSPYFLMLMDKVANDMDEDTIKGLTPGAQIVSVAEIKSQIASVRSEMDKIERDIPHKFRTDPRYKDLKLQKTELFKKQAG